MRMGSFDELSGFYDLDYPDTSDHEFLRRLVTAADPRHLLEVPCGSGRNVVPLLEASRGRVTFADLAESMVGETTDKIPAADRARASAVTGDLTALGYRAEFDLLICPREAFQLLSRTEAAQALSSMAASLSQDGLIVIDLFTFDSRQPAPEDSPPDYFRQGQRGWAEDWTRSTAGQGLTVTRRRRQRLTAAGARFEMSYTVRTAAAPEPQSIELAFEMVNHTREEFGQLAAASGLTVLATLAGYGAAAADRPAEADRSLRTVFVLGQDGVEDGGERLHRIRAVIAPDGAPPEADRADPR